jgi:hypothetical protein
MARGMQAIQSQQANAKKANAEKKRKANKGAKAAPMNAESSAKCKICMQLIQQLSLNKPGSLKVLSGHIGSKHNGKGMIDCFPDWTEEAMELRRNPVSQGESKEEVFDEYSAEVAVRAMDADVRKAAIAKVGGKDGWAPLSWMDRYLTICPKTVEYKADKEVKGKKKQTHKRH